MLRNFTHVVALAVILIFCTSCSAAQETDPDYDPDADRYHVSESREEYEAEHDNAPDMDRHHVLENREEFLTPAVNLNGRIYSLYAENAVGILDETYILMGIVASYNPYLCDATKNLQASHPHVVGARVFHSGDNLITVCPEGVHSLFRYDGDWVIGWQAIDEMPQRQLYDEYGDAIDCGSQQPFIHFNGRLYGIHARIFPPNRYSGEPFVLVGVVSSHRWLIDSDPVNLLTNAPRFVGASIYQSGDSHFAVIEDGAYFPLRFSGHMTDNWEVFE